MSKKNGDLAKIITPAIYQERERNTLIGPNGWMLFVACNSAIDLARAVKDKYDSYLEANNSHCRVQLLGTKENPLTRVFPDTETCPRFDISVSGSDVYVFQNIHENISGNTVNENLIQMFQVCFALKEHGAKKITAITPYGAYSRQDKPTFMNREPTTAKMVADFLRVCGVATHIVYHPHTYALYGCYGTSIRYTPLSGLHLFMEIFREMKNKDKTVVVSVDAGAAKFTIHFANKMGLPYAISNKFRSSGEKTEILGLIGDLKDKTIAIVIDDETITGTSIINAVKKLYTDFGIHEIYVGISHLKLKEKYYDSLIEAHEKFGLKELHVTDSIPQDPNILKHDFIVRHTLVEKIASTINHLHYNQSITEIFEMN